MILTSHGMTNSGLNFNGEYQAVLDYAESQGFTLPNESQQLKQNDLVGALVNEGIWEDLDVFYVFANNGSSNFGRINWIDPGTFNAIETSEGPDVILPTWNSNQGYTGTQIGFSYGFLTTGYNALAGNNFSQSNGSIFVWTYNNLTAVGDRDIGFRDNLTGFRPDWGSINPSTSGTLAQYTLLSTGFTTFTSSVTGSAGFNHLARISGSQISFYKNGALLATQNSNLATVDVTTLELNILNGGAGGAGGHSLRTVSIGGAGAALSTKSSQFYTLLNNYMTTL